MIRIQDIFDEVHRYQAGADLSLIQKAYVFSAKSHQGQLRRSGEPYLTHPLEVAMILAQMRLDVASVAAGLLHDTVEDTVATLDELEELFGAEVRHLVDGVTKLGKIRFRTSEEKQAENFRKMIMAMAQDIRVILIKLADRTHNMRTLSYLAEAKRVGIAQETLDIYAPIANRLGIQQLKIELEDLSFQYLRPDVYQMIAERIQQRSVQREKFVSEVKALVVDELGKHQISAEVQGRLKHFYSIHRKMEAQNIPFDEVYDLTAFRIIVETLSQCYETLGFLHALWRPIPGRFKDYIAMPKQNDYRSLHTTVMGPHGERCEFQIRTREMHDIAERGIAAHWRYKESDGTMAAQDEMKFKWVRQLLQWQRELNEPAEFLDTIKLDLFADDIYVFTPQGHLKELPRGATAIDFAYEVHTDVGHACVGARVNGRIVPLRHPLRSGDTVEIMTGKQKHPNKDWLQFARTSRAKAKIRQFLRAQERDQAEAIGRELLEKALERYHVSPTKILKSGEMHQFLQEQNIRELSGLMVAMGYGKILPEDVLQAVLPKDLLQQSAEAPKKESAISRFVDRVRRHRSKSPVKISGISDVLVAFGKCCNPVPGDIIVGFVTRGRGVSVHRSDCPRIIGSDPARCVPVEWDTEAHIMRIARIRVVCVDRPGLLANMTEAITDKGVNITQALVRTSEDHKAINTFDVEISDIHQLRQVLQNLEKVRGVISVERING